MRAKDDRSARGWTLKQLVQRLVKGICAADSALADVSSHAACLPLVTDGIDLAGGKSQRQCAVTRAGNHTCHVAVPAHKHNVFLALLNCDIAVRNRGSLGHAQCDDAALH